MVTPQPKNAPMNMFQNDQLAAQSQGAPAFGNSGITSLAQLFDEGHHVNKSQEQEMTGAR